MMRILPSAAVLAPLSALLVMEGCGGITKEQAGELAIASAQGPIIAALTAAPNTPQGARVYSAVARTIKGYCRGLQTSHSINRDNINALLIGDDIAIAIACPDEVWPDDPR